MAGKPEMFLDVQPNLGPLVFTNKPRKMKAINILLITLLISITASAQNWGWNKRNSVKGNGDVVTQTRDVTDFTGIKACCSFDVELTPGSTFEVVVEAESNLQEYIRTEVRGRTLELGFKDDASINSTKKIRIFVTMPELELIDASSSADIVTNGVFKGERLKLESSSGSSISAQFEGGRVSADASSAGRVEVIGTADEITAEASSGANVKAGKLMAKRGDADVSSGAGIEVNVSEELKADASSGGRVRYDGNPSNVDTDTSSGGSVRRG